MRHVKLIMFDLDGTLVDSRYDITNAVNFALKEIGFREKSMAEVTSYIGNGVRELIKKVLGEKNGIFFEKALAMFTDYYREHSSDNSVLYPGVLEILEFFKDKRKIIITNRNYEFAVITLKLKGIYNYFDTIVGGDDIGCMKPSSCPLDKSMYDLKVDKNKAIMVGDMDIDILAGKKAGVITCGVTYGIGNKDDIVKANPDYIIENILELKKIIN